MITFALLILLIYFCVVCFVGYIIFAPFRLDVARAPTKGARFQLTDLLALFLPFQIGFAVINLFFDDIVWNVQVAISISILLLVISFLAWIYGMRLLWRMNVRSAMKRIVLLGLVMPFGCVVPAITLPTMLSGNTVPGLALRLVSLIVVVILLRFLATWVRSGQMELAGQN